MTTKSGIVKQVQGITFAGRSDSGHWVMMDGSPTFGGSSAAGTPKELLLLALGGCTGSDIAPILKKKGTPVEEFEIKLTAKVRDEHPQIFTDIHIEYVFRGEGIDVRDIERAIELSTTKYCSISAMLTAAVKITHSYKIELPVRMSQKETIYSS